MINLSQNQLLLELTIYKMMRQRQARKEIQKELANYRPSRYSTALKKYQRSALRKAEPILKMIARQCPLSSLHPTFKALKAIAKMLFLNQIELCFMLIALRKTNWMPHNHILDRQSRLMSQLVCNGGESAGFRRLSLMLMLVGFAAKQALNDQCQWLVEEVEKLCPQFKNIFQQWFQEYPLLFVIRPWQLNQIYARIHKNQISQAADHNSMVDTIIQLSHSYNSPHQMPQAPQIPTKCKQKIQNFTIQAAFEPIQISKACIQPHSYPIKKGGSSIRLLDHQDMSQSGFKLDGMLGSSVFGGPLLPSLHLSKQQEYLQVELGPGDMNFMVFNNDPTFSQVPCLQRGNSNQELAHSSDAEQSYWPIFQS